MNEISAKNVWIEKKFWVVSQAELPSSHFFLKNREFMITPPMMISIKITAPKTSPGLRAVGRSISDVSAVISGAGVGSWNSLMGLIWLMV